MPQGADENRLRVKQANCPKRGKTRVTKSWLPSVLNLIVWEGGAGVLDQSWREFMQHQSNPGWLSTLIWKFRYIDATLCTFRVLTSFLFSAILARPRASDRSKVNVPETSPKSELLGINFLLFSKICNSCSLVGRNHTSVDVSGFKFF